MTKDELVARLRDIEWDDFDLQSHEVEKSDVAKNVAKNLTERQQQIVALISENPQTTRAEMAAAIGVATKTIERELASLSDVVRYVGSKKGGHWEIITCQTQQ